MSSGSVPLYFGDDFGFMQKYSPDVIKVWFEEGEVAEVRMPMPTRNKPDRYKTVFRYLGPKSHKIRDVSATMGPKVTEQVLKGSGHHKAIVKSWHPKVAVSVQIADWEGMYHFFPNMNDAPALLRVPDRP